MRYEGMSVAQNIETRLQKLFPYLALIGIINSSASSIKVIMVRTLTTMLILKYHYNKNVLNLTLFQFVERNCTHW